MLLQTGRRLSFEARNPIYKNKRLCEEIIEKYKNENRLIPREELQDEAAMHWHCHEISDTTQGKYPIEKRMTNDGRKSVLLHVAACTAQNGVAVNGGSSSYSNFATMMSASHICQNDRCIRPSHLCWETLRDNISRRGCYGYAKSGENIGESKLCKHNPRCKTIMFLPNWF